jgi:hypothetical protein
MALNAGDQIMLEPKSLGFGGVKWTWACRRMVKDGPTEAWSLQLDESKPEVGDVAIVEVEKIGHHGRIDTGDGGRLRLYKGDRLACVFGNRYATDVYEGRVRNVKRLHLLTSSGLVGTVTSRHLDVRRPSRLSFLGYVVDGSGIRLNTRKLFFSPVDRSCSPAVILVIGTGMNTGKTTVTRKILRGLVSQGVHAAGCKLTGTASPRDLREYRSTNPVHAMDFSDFGLPSTYHESPGDLLLLLDSMLETCGRKGADVLVMEVADGFLQRETRMLLESEHLRSLTTGVVLSGACASSAFYGAEYLQKAGFNVWAVSGLMTNSPLFIREFRKSCSIPVATSKTGSARLVKTVLKNLQCPLREALVQVL